MRAFTARAAVLSLILLAAGSVGAQGRGGHGHGGGGGGGRDGGGRAYAPRGGYERGPAAGGAGFIAPAGRGVPVDPRYGPGLGDYPSRAYAPPPAYYPTRPGRGASAFVGGGGSWRRGEFLPRNYWGGAALDTRRYHLRSAPPGYGWYAIGRDGYLVQRSSGLILDTAPGIQ